MSTKHNAYEENEYVLRSIVNLLIATRCYKEDFAGAGFSTKYYEYSYYDNDVIQTITVTYGSYRMKLAFDQYGRIANKDNDARSVSVEYNDSDPGRAETATATWSEAGGRGSTRSILFAFSYNEEGQLSSITRDGEAYMEYKYQYISKPSAMVRINASNPIRIVDLETA